MSVKRAEGTRVGGRGEDSEEDSFIGFSRRRKAGASAYAEPTERHDGVAIPT